MQLVYVEICSKLNCSSEHHFLKVYLPLYRELTISKMDQRGSKLRNRHKLRSILLLPDSWTIHLSKCKSNHEYCGRRPHMAMQDHFQIKRRNRKNESS